MILLDIYAYFKELYHVSVGCLPTLATIPVWIGLYQALSNVANEVTKLLILYGH